ncbi:MAG: helix-turn-helix domain-containing protein, partial [bacterium]
ELKEKLKKEGWDIKKLVTSVCELLGVDEKEIKRESRRSKLSQARSLITYFGHEKLAITGAELAKYFGVTKSSISSAICRGRKIAYENEYRIV